MGESAKRSVAACLACVVALMLLAGLAYGGGSAQRLDAEVLRELSAAPGSTAAALAAPFMHSADLLPLIALLAVACGLALRFGRRREALAALVLVAGANLTTQIIKAVLAHPRYAPILGYRQIGSASFPSGHATASLSIALAFVLAVPRPWRLPVALAGAVFSLAVAGAILVLNRHFPGDVLGGWLVVGAWFFALLAGYSAGPWATRDG